MATLTRRPYIGNYQENVKNIVQHSPDAVVLINGDVTLPGCATCNARIDLNKYITSISVSASTDPGGLTGNLSLSIPRHANDSFIRDAQFLLRPALEVEILMRGYFPVEDLYENNPVLQRSPAFDQIEEESILNYPYYPVFRGVVENVNHSYSGGFYQASLTCSSLLSFWNYQNISTNASLFGARPTNSKLRMSLVGHNYTKMTPYEILYTMFHDTFGAASGVAFALRNKTNLSAYNNELGKSLFSIAIDYWKKRFSGRITNLRLHGVSGVLFNAAQAAFLSRLSTSKVGQLLRGRFPTKDQVSKNVQFLAAARELGLYDQKYADALVFLEKTRPTDRPAALNIAQMQAFAMNIQQFGTVNIFESTYESKLSIVQKITELTGFEFYQDVDGDFVFKPPLYNLDTSQSRVYRIEDEDIISLSHDERPPAVTVMTVKGSHFKNVLGLGLDNEWGVRGQFVDYKLVAQFGWRMQSFDTSYYNNPREMFFAAINRMDILNSEVNTASLTIPIRPELRPGYPIYIPSMDCFYYIKSLSHSFSFGGQCTTSIELTAKRAKFYAPGDPDKFGIDSIDLNQMTLPRKPLVTKEQDSGEVKLSGFPNVVLALDPNKVSPLFLARGADASNIDNPRQLQNLLLSAAENVGAVSVDPDNPNQYVLQEENGSKIILKLDGRNRNGAVNILDAARQYKKAKTQFRTSKSKSSKLIAKLGGQVERLQRRRENIQRSRRKNQSTVTSLTRQIERLQKKISNLRRENVKKERAVKEKIENNEGFRALRRLLDLLGEEFVKKDATYENPNSTTNYLDLLSNKKSAFTNSKVPGSYRYYSASHPDPKHQGQPELELTEERGTFQKINTPRLRDVLGGGFRRYPTKFFKNSGFPEAERQPNFKASRGIRILTNNPARTRDVVTTDRIRTLAFAVHSADVERRQVTLTSSTNGEFDADSYRASFRRAFTTLSKNAKLSETPFSVYNPLFSSLIGTVSGTDLSRFLTDSAFPSEVAFRGFTVSTSSTFTSILTQVGKTKITQVTPDFEIILSGVLVSRILAAIQSFRDQKIQPLLTQANDGNASDEQRNSAKQEEQRLEAAISKVTNALGSFLKTQKTNRFRTSKRKVKKIKKKEDFFTPIFPVSDQKGYEVVGNYRYGRDVEIQPGGTLEQIYNTDVTRLADRNAIDEYIEAISRGAVTRPVTKGNGATQNRRVGGTEAVKEAERKLIESIKANPAAKNIIRTIVAKSGKDPDNAGQVDAALANFISNSRDASGKLPVVNTARSLGDIQNRVINNVCSCRAFEADLLTDALQQEDFVFVSKDDQNNQEATTKWYTEQMIKQEKDWKERQDALAGRNKVLSGLKDLTKKP